MTTNLYATQQDWLTYLRNEADFEVYDTTIPEVENEPRSNNGYMEAYAVMRFNDSVKLPTKDVVGGARHDEKYTLIDVLCVAADPDDARQLAYGPDGVIDILEGYVAVDAGELNKSGGGNVFTINDGTSTKPTRYIARVSFRAAVNMVVDE